MKKFKNFDFLLEDHPDTTEEEYNRVQKIICDACFPVVFLSERQKLPDMTISFPITTSKVYGTINVSEQTVRFGVYYDGEIYQSASIELFDVFILSNASEIIMKRIDNNVKLFLEGKRTQKQMAPDEVVDAWNVLLRKNQTIER